MDEKATYAAVVGQVIQRLRSIHKQMSQQVLAVQAQLSQSALSRFEKGQTLPDLYETRRLARALGRTPTEFMELVERSYASATEVAKKVPTSTTDSLAAVAIAGAAILGVVAILGEVEKQKKRRR